MGSLPYILQQYKAAVSGQPWQRFRSDSSCFRVAPGATNKGSATAGPLCYVECVVCECRSGEFSL